MSSRILVYILFLVVLAGGVWAYYALRPESGDVGLNTDTHHGCTMEALLCPDGSSVGRSGPQCQFAACPSQPSYVGTLEQTQYGLRLIIASPKTEMPDAATYAIPLDIHITNALGDFVGTNVRVFGAFSEGNTYKADHIEPLAPTESAHEVTEDTLAVGEMKFINGVKVTLNTIVSDNRCPAHVQCIVAGAVVANVTLVSDTDRETLDLRSDAKPHGFDSFQVSIASVSPIRTTDTTPTSKDYRVTFKVTPLE
jgi:hypothetical protein